MADGIELPIADMQRWLREIRAQEEPIRTRALTLAGEVVLSEAQVAAPVLTGVLKESHGRTEVRNGAISLFANTSYAIARHQVFPDKPGHQWFTKAMAAHAPRALEGGLRIALRDAGAQRA